MCSEGRYSPMDGLFMMPILTVSGELAPEKQHDVFHYILTKCSVCGNIQMYSASAIGIWK